MKGSVHNISAVDARAKPHRTGDSSRGHGADHRVAVAIWRFSSSRVLWRCDSRACDVSLLTSTKITYLRRHDPRFGTGNWTNSSRKPATRV